MSDELKKKIEDLTTENNNLKATLQNNANGIQTVLAQLDAHKQMINENNQIGVNLRTNIILFQKQNEMLNEQLKIANSKIVELEAKIAEKPEKNVSSKKG